MKNSGIPWIGEIPYSWVIVNPKGIFIARKERARKDDLMLTASQKYGMIPQQQYDDVESYRTVKVIKDEEILKHVEPGDFVISMRSFQGGLEYSRYRGKMSSAYLALCPRQNVSIVDGYYKYLFKSEQYILALQLTSNYIRDGQALRYSNFAQVPFPYPSLNEQRRIADYLDACCIDIDKVKQTLVDEIEALQRLRKATIHKAVTNGLDDGVPMKDSGTPWIGKMPSAWELPRFKTVYKQVKRIGYENEDLLSVYLNRGVILFSDDDGVRVHKTSSDTSGYQLVVPGQLVMNNQQAWRGSVGVSSLRGIISPAYHVYEARQDNRMDDRYANYMFRSCMVPAYELCSHGVGTIQRNISPEEFGYELIPVPPIHEQQRIADYLDKRCAAIDSIIETRTKQLERLEDYRKALVFAYVTGKKEVPQHE